MDSSAESPDTVGTQFLDLSDPVALRCGTTLRGVRIAYETYGELNAAKDNAVLLFHAMTGSQHSAGFNPAVEGVGDRWTDECRTGWWDEFIGPGRALDTRRIFVICANYIGGCYGSTGPSTVNPGTGRPFGAAFPRVGIADMVDVQMRLVDHLGIAKLRAVIGASIGGMMALSLATLHPDRVRLVAPIGSGLDVTPLQRILNFEQIFAIESDPAFQGGDYYGGLGPERGLAQARMIAHKTFVSLRDLMERARGEVVADDPAVSWYGIHHPLESYMLHQGRKFVGRFDANTYLRILDAWQRYDLRRDAGVRTWEELFARCGGQRYLIFSIDSDVAFYPEEQEIMTRVLKNAGVEHIRLTVHSEKGHDSFLLEPELYMPHLHYALG